MKCVAKIIVYTRPSSISVVTDIRSHAIIRVCGIFQLSITSKLPYNTNGITIHCIQAATFVYVAFGMT